MDAALTRFIERAKAIPRLSREAEHELALAARQGDSRAAHRLVEANLRFAIAVAIQYRRYGIPLSELIAEGSVGLMQAVRKFDPERGTRFSTYAGYWVRAYVLDLVVKSASIVGGGSGALRSKVCFRQRRERARIQTLETDPERLHQILAQRFGVDTERMAGMLRQLDAKDLSLDVPAHPNSTTTMLDALVDDHRDQETRLMTAERDHRLNRELGQAMETLDQRERYIVEQRIMEEDGVSLAELGRRLGVSRERARQLEARAKRKLRERLQPDAA